MTSVTPVFGARLGGVTMDPGLRAAYLDRLGLDEAALGSPSVDALAELHRRHVERVPYETVWIHAGERWGIDPADSVERIASQGRGGYCFHLNGAFSELLRSLGYSVSRHVGGVHGPAGPDRAELTNHLVLTVAGLPTDANPSGVWYVDAGLGDALHEPVPLAAGPIHQEPYTMRLEAALDAAHGATPGATPGGVGDWHLTHDPHGSFVGMSWQAGAVEMDVFADRHQWLSTSPESNFVRLLTVQRRDATGVDVLRGLTLSRRTSDGPGPGVALTERADWFAALADIFGLTLDHVDPALLDGLWERTKSAHDAWAASQSP